ncbi:MAG: 16S rRNA (uracil(1498)-N(3))-methyltransferase [Spirochaetia bacterium]|nr:16S rRNA (uracil(1498)-N(3))-methyltransferase [Spirochaetia bacterium]
MAIFLLFRPGEAFAPGSTIVLKPDEQRHVKARRLRPGETIYVGDGAGRRFQTALGPDYKTLTEVSLTVHTQAEPRRVLFTAIPDPGRFEWLLEKAVETGVTDVVPVIYSRSAKSAYNAARAERIVLAAAEQSERWIIPRIESPVLFSEAVSRALELGCLVLDAGGGALPQSRRAGACLVGPEGGFTENELRDIDQAGLPKVRLNAGILRVETAAVAGLVLLALS